MRRFLVGMLFLSSVASAQEPERVPAYVLGLDPKITFSAVEQLEAQFGKTISLDRSTWDRIFKSDILPTESHWRLIQTLRLSGQFRLPNRIVHVKNGLLHREDGPALTYLDSDYQAWYLNGLLDRVNGPAVTRDNVEEWYMGGMRHRIGGPAIIHKNGSMVWYQFDKIHRTNGPAIIEANGTVHWYLNGQSLRFPLEIH